MFRDPLAGGTQSLAGGDDVRWMAGVLRVWESRDGETFSSERRGKKTAEKKISIIISPKLHQVVLPSWQQLLSSDSTDVNYMQCKVFLSTDVSHTDVSSLNLFTHVTTPGPPPPRRPRTSTAKEARDHHHHRGPGPPCLTSCPAWSSGSSWCRSWINSEFLHKLVFKPLIFWLLLNRHLYFYTLCIHMYQQQMF